MTIYYEKSIPKNFSSCFTTNTKSTTVATNAPSTYNCESESDVTPEILLQGKINKFK